MTLLELAAVLKLDDAAYKRGLDSAEKEANESSSKIGNVMGGMAKGVAAAAAAAAAAATAAIASLTKQAVESYANYEQLIGGVETLFKDSADAVSNYAQNAFATAGLSANQYMDTVTSFSASLIASLGGDTAAAAEVANTAIVDMADNANKMGTAMESVQSVYSALAKQNFTLLDNLKLGYGGTKAEAERMVADANRIKEANGEAANLTIASFADMVEAIHTVQENMGIAGATAEEAASTIEGSLNAMKASWENLITGLADPNANLGELIDGFVQTASTALNNLLPVVTQAIGGIAQMIGQLAPVLISEVPNLIKQLIPALLSALPQIFQALAAELPNLVVMITNTLLDMLPMLIESAVEMVIEIVIGLLSHLPEIIAKIVMAIPRIVEALIDGIIDGLLGGFTSQQSAYNEMGTTIGKGIGSSAGRTAGQTAGIEFMKTFDSVTRGFSTLIGVNLNYRSTGPSDISVDKRKGVTQKKMDVSKSASASTTFTTNYTGGSYGGGGGGSSGGGGGGSATDPYVKLLQDTQKAIQNATKYQKLGLSEQEKLWSDALKKFKQGTEQYAQIEETIFDLRWQQEQELQKQKEKAESDFYQNSIDKAVKYYDRVTDLEKTYAEEWQKTYDKIYNAYSLFSDVNRQKLDPMQVRDSLIRQVGTMQQFDAMLKTLSDKGASSELVNAIMEQGVGSIDYLDAILRMTDRDFEIYNAAFLEKGKTAARQTEERMAGAKAAVDTEIDGIIGDIDELFSQESPSLGLTLAEGIAKGIATGEQTISTAASKLASSVWGAFGISDNLSESTQNGESNSLIGALLGAVKDSKSLGIYLDGDALVGGISDRMNENLADKYSTDKRVGV